jgi:hypothetical protein
VNATGRDTVKDGSMAPIYEPAQLTDPTLKEYAVIAAWIDTLAETIDDLEDLLIELPRQEPLMPDFHTPWPWEFDTMAVALAVVKTHRTEVIHALEELLATWLGEDPEHGPVFQMTLVDPWQERPGIWSEDTPEWIRTFATITARVHAKHGPVDRPAPD